VTAPEESVQGAGSSEAAAPETPADTAAEGGNDAADIGNEPGTPTGETAPAESQPAETPTPEAKAE
jgi:hypothetical protein